MMRKGGKMGSVHDVAKAQSCPKLPISRLQKPGRHETRQSPRKGHEAAQGPRGLGRAVGCGLRRDQCRKTTTRGRNHFLGTQHGPQKVTTRSLRLGRIKLFTGFQTGSSTPSRRIAWPSRLKLRAKGEIEAFYAQIKADEQANEERQKQMLEGAAQEHVGGQYQLILNIFSKMTGDKTPRTTASGRA